MGKLADMRKAEWDAMMKDLIYKATMSVLDKHGLDGLKMERVAKRAEVSIGTLYNYFKDKDELLIYVMETTFEPFGSTLLKVRAEDSRPEEKLQKFITLFIRKFVDRINFINVIDNAMRRSLPIAEVAVEKYKIILNALADIIEEGIEKGTFRDMDRIAAAKMIMGAMDGLFQIRIHDRDSCGTVEKEISDCADLILNGLFNPGRSDDDV